MSCFNEGAWQSVSAAVTKSWSGAQVDLHSKQVEKTASGTLWKTAKAAAPAHVRRDEVKQRTVLCSDCLG